MGLKRKSVTTIFELKKKTRNHEKSALTIDISIYKLEMSDRKGITNLIVIDSEIMNQINLFWDVLLL